MHVVACDAQHKHCPKMGLGKKNSEKLHSREARNNIGLVHAKGSYVCVCVLGFLSHPNRSNPNYALFDDLRTPPLVVREASILIDSHGLM